MNQNSPKSLSARLREIWRLAGRVNPYDKKVLTWLYLYPLLATVFYEGSSYGYSNPRFWIGSAASYFVLVGTYLLLMLPFKKIPRLAAAALGKTVVVYLAYLLKTLTIVWIVAEDPSSAMELWLLRAPGDATVILVSWIALATAVTANNDYQISLAGLNRLSEELESQRSSRTNAAANANKKLRKLALEQLQTELDKITKGLRTAKENRDAWRLSAEIKNLINEKVRPLSQDLIRRIDLLSDARLEKYSPLGTGHIRSLAVSPRLDARFGIAYLAASLNIFVTISQLSSLGAAFGVFVISLSFPLIAQTMTWFWKPQSRLPLGKALIWGAAVSLIAYLPTLAAIHYFSVQFATLEVIRFTAFFVIVFLTVGFSFWATFQRSRDEQLNQIERHQAEIQRELALIDQAIWLARRKWAYLIHGTVQGALTVASSRLVFSPEPSRETIQQVIKDVEKAKRAITQPIEFNKTAKELCSDIRRSWQDLCQVNFEVSDEVLSELDKNEAGRSCFIELVKELVSNAYRHGQAKNIWIAAFITPEKDLKLIASDDGKQIDPSYQPGIGFEMFDELTSSWKIEFEGQSKIVALIPLERIET